MIIKKIFFVDLLMSYIVIRYIYETLSWAAFCLHKIFCLHELGESPVLIYWFNWVLAWIVGSIDELGGSSLLKTGSADILNSLSISSSFPTNVLKILYSYNKQFILINI